MKKMIFKSALLAIVGVGLMASSAISAPLPTASYLAGVDYEWVANDSWTITDLSSSQAQFQLTYENTRASYESSFGLYTVNEDGTTVTATHEIFSSTQEPGAIFGPTEESVWFQFDSTNSIWQISDAVDGIYSDFGTTFGFYSDIFTGGETDTDKDYTWYSDSRFNTDHTSGSAVSAYTDVEHIFTAYNAGNHSTMIFLEDKTGGYVEGDNIDLMVSTTDVAPVPEPATMLLFGTGLAGLAGFSRRKKSKKA